MPYNTYAPTLPVFRKGRGCHPACKCREAKVEELVGTVKKLINGKDPSDATLIAIVRDAVSAVEGVKI